MRPNLQVVITEGEKGCSLTIVDLAASKELHQATYETIERAFLEAGRYIAQFT